MAEKRSFLKSLIYEDAPETQQSAPSQAQPIYQTTQKSGEGDDPRMKEILQGALDEEGQRGFGYVKFKQSLEAMKSVISDEKTRFVSCFVTVSTMGVTKAKLLETAETAKRALDREQKKFDDAAKTHTEETLGGEQKQLQEMEATIQSKNEAVQKLAAEIGELQKQKTEKETQIKSEQIRAESMSKSFEFYYNQMVGEIQTDVKKISDYLGG